jgi:uncharacterized protein
MFSSNQTISRPIADFMYKVYAWMSGALTISALTAFAVFSTPALFNAVMNRGAMIIMFLVQMGLVFAFMGMINRVSFSVASLMFGLYAVSLGVTLSVLFAVYTMSSIGQVFLITAAMFGSMAIYGYYTRTDLSTMGSIMGMGLWGIIIASLVNMFFQNSVMHFAISVIAVIIFTGLTAYDVQKIKQLGYSTKDQGVAEDKAALIGAFILYLDFINLFVHLMQLLGVRRRD